MLRRGFLFTVILVLFCSSGLASGRNQAEAAPGPDHSSPLLFIPWEGSRPGSIGYLALGGEQAIFLERDGFWVQILKSVGSDPALGTSEVPLPEPPPAALVHLQFLDANPEAALEPNNRLDTQVSEFRGKDPAGWHPDLPAWGGVRYRNLYPGLDLEISAGDGEWAPRLVSQAGAELGAVRLQVEGAQSAALEENGLKLHTAVGDLRLPLLAVDRAPGTAPEVIPGENQEASFEVRSPFAFQNNRSPSMKKAIPASALIYSTYLGGSSADEAIDVAVDRDGAAYVLGWTISWDLPFSPGAYDTSLNGGYDWIAAKVNPDGTALEYLTVLGGNDADYGFAIAVDRQGSAYLSGRTASTNFPTTAGAFDESRSGYSDAVVVKLDPAGARLVYSTLIGGSNFDQCNDLAVTPEGLAYLAGDTESPDFPLTENAADRSQEGIEAWVAVLSENGARLQYATLLGGIGWDTAAGVAIGRGQLAYVAGRTDQAAGFPLTPNAFDSRVEYHDIFLAVLDVASGPVRYATFLGGSDFDNPSALVVDRRGDAYLIGSTFSPDFPTTESAFDRTYENLDAFIARVSPSRSELVYATFLGGSGSEEGWKIAVDRRGVAYVAGITGSTDFPTGSSSLFPNLAGIRDGFVAQISAGGDRLLYSTYFGGSSADSLWGLALDQYGSVYMTGWTYSTDLPVTPGVFGPEFKGLYGEIFVARLWIHPWNMAGAPLLNLESIGDLDIHFPYITWGGGGVGR